MNWQGDDQELEWWDQSVICKEMDGFFERYELLRWLGEENVREWLGEPDELGLGYLSYYGALAYTVVRFEIVKGLVQDIMFYPKVRRCPDNRREELGGMYAPE